MNETTTAKSTKHYEKKETKRAKSQKNPLNVPKEATKVKKRRILTSESDSEGE